MADHTPTPWTATEDRDWTPHSCCHDAAVTSFVYGKRRTLAETHSPADAAFIVKAVNSHDALKASLAEMVGIYWGDGDGHEPPPACIQRALAALASIKETV